MSLYPGLEPYPIDPEWRTGGRLAVAAAARRLGLVIPSASAAAKPLPAHGPVVMSYLARRAAIRAKIRRSPGWIAGYAGLHLVKHSNGQWYARGCFDRAVHQTGVLLLKNHDVLGVAYADVDDQTLLMGVDALGLWFEASAFRLLDVVRGGSATCSLGCARMVATSTVNITDIDGLNELSVLEFGRKPRCPGTWVLPGATALVRRDAAIATFRAHSPYDHQLNID